METIAMALAVFGIVALALTTGSGSVAERRLGDLGRPEQGGADDGESGGSGGGIVVSGVAGGVAGGAAGGAAGGVAGTGGGRWTRWPGQNRQRRPDGIGVDAVLMALVAHLKAGSSVGDALRRAMPADAAVPASGFVTLTGDLDADGLGETLESCRRRDEKPALARQAASGLAAACRLSAATGCRAADAVAAVARSCRRGKLRDDLQASAFAVPKATVQMLTVLPPATLLLAGLLGARPLAFLFGSPSGLLCLFAGAGCYALGLAWIRLLMDDSSGSPSGALHLGPALVLELVAVTMRQGASIPAALQSVGDVCGGPVGAAMRHAAHALLAGATWHEAWRPCRRDGIGELDKSDDGEEPGADGEATLAAETTTMLLRDALRSPWEDGCGADIQLDAAAERLDAAERMAIEQRASRLSVRLLMPMGLCFLPAFLLLAIVPAIVSFAMQA
ncbi:type II secretion system F family protein [Bifidobacterium choloepi]|uniref:Uncharacterized protein n=1 Tax=Bifidobacterium choloepi TaxID=2614131 RepID=A0A6I5NBH4_9BIFI|nr:type II secretion system F family protein [Bifidobacterium choloepi]NEG69840.1 hypothetical protein [Bifidobacterium choloepi]